MFERDLGGSPARLNLRTLRGLLDCCLSNAQQLLASAEILFNQKMYSTSMLLSILAIEELGKRRILGRYVWAEDDDKERHKLWRSFHNHKHKIYWALRHLLHIGLDAGQNAKVDYISLWFKEHQELRSDATVINQMKQLATYTNVIKGQVINPSRFARRQRASDLLGLSKGLLADHSVIEPTDKIMEDYKLVRRKKKKGESMMDYLGRLRGWERIVK